MLESIELASTGRRTTRLGFGGSGLMGGLSERESLRLLETAFDAGIRHFDVAPSYGHGMAERCLGKFLRGKRNQITIATKYGILPPQHNSLVAAARTALRPLARRLPSVRNRLAQAAAGLKTKARFSAEEARHSLEHSLRELEVERIDLWLLHEATADDLDGSDLLPFLEQMRQQGRIAAYGVGTDRSCLESLWEKHREYCRTLQYEWRLHEMEPSLPGAFVIHHRAVANGLAVVRGVFERDPALCRRWSDAIDANLAASETLGSLFLLAALSASPGTIVLFSSRAPAHIRTNVHRAGDAAWAKRSRHFLELIAKEPIRQN